MNPDYDHYVKDEQLQNGTGEGWMTKDNKKIGKWILRYEDRIEEGEYLNGKKINQWIITNKITNVIETGCYDNLNFKTGEWISYVEGDSASYLKIIYNRNKEQKRIKVDSILISTIKLKQ